MGTDTTTVSPATLRAEMVAKVRKSGDAQLSGSSGPCWTHHVMSSCPTPHWPLPTTRGRR
jgi:hypothetical protein